MPLQAMPVPRTFARPTGFVPEIGGAVNFAKELPYGAPLMVWRACSVV